VTAAAALRKLQEAGVEVFYEAPDRIRLRGPISDDLVALARAAKPELIASVRPRVQAYACSCCGRFSFVEPAAVCFWCRRGKLDIRGRTPPGQRVQSNHGRQLVDRRCPSCGGGMHSSDPDGAVCFTCRVKT